MVEGLNWGGGGGGRVHMALAGLNFITLSLVG